MSSKGIAYWQRRLDDNKETESEQKSKADEICKLARADHAAERDAEWQR